MGSPIAICPLHGPFTAAAVEISAGATVTITNSETTCPRCGRWSPIVDGTYSFVGNVVRIVQAASRADIEALRQVARTAQSGKVAPQEAQKQAAEINASFAQLPLATPGQDPIALWGLLLMILSFMLAVQTKIGDDQATDRAHQDAQKQLAATQSAEQVSQKIHEELRRQADAATATAEAAAKMSASQERRPATGPNRHERRKNAALARKKVKR